MSSTRVLSAGDVAAIVDIVGVHALMDAMIDSVNAAFLGYDDQEFSVPVRSGVNYSSPAPGLVEWMPVLAKGRNAFAKTVTYHPRNPSAHQRPSIASTGSLYDIETGRLTALSDLAFLTALRTGAASAVASRLLAEPESAILGVIGAGAQAVTQIHALSRCFPIREILFCDIDPAATASLIARVRGLIAPDTEVRQADIGEIVRQSDILCTCTSIEAGEGPLFADMKTQSWLHINAVGADFPGKTELPTSLLQRGLVVPDFREQAVIEGECQRLEAAEIGPDIVKVLQTDGANYAGRTRLTVFDSTGYAIEDYAAMLLILDLAERHNVGVMMDLSASIGDPLNPYAREDRAQAAAE